MGLTLDVLVLAVLRHLVLGAPDIKEERIQQAVLDLVMVLEVGVACMMGLVVLLRAELELLE